VWEKTFPAVYAKAKDLIPAIASPENLNAVELKPLFEEIGSPGQLKTMFEGFANYMGPIFPEALALKKGSLMIDLNFFMNTLRPRQIHFPLCRA
jgi:hypothetical protein